MNNTETKAEKPNTHKLNPAVRLAIDFIVIIAFLFVLIFVIILPQYKYDMNASILDKIERAQSVHAPQLLLVGDSDLVFGIDSAKIEKEVGMSVVNMGLHAGLGDEFLLNMAKFYSEPGDVVVVSFVRYIIGDDTSNEELTWVTLENRFKLYRFIAPKDSYRMIKAFPSYLRDAINLWLTGRGNLKEETGYSRSYFNEYGDSEFERPEQIQLFKDSDGLPALSDEFVEHFNNLCHELNERGVKVVVAAPPIYVCENTPSKEEYKAFEETLRSKLDCEVISDFTEYYMDKDYFWDSKFHLNEKGVPIRTELLINDIKVWMNNRGDK